MRVSAHSRDSCCFHFFTDKIKLLQDMAIVYMTEDGYKKLLENYSDGKLISQENFNDEGFFIKTFTTLKNIAYKIRNIFTFIADFWIVFVFLVLPVIGILALIYEAIFKRKK